MLEKNRLTKLILFFLMKKKKPESEKVIQIRISYLSIDIVVKFSQIRRYSFAFEAGTHHKIVIFLFLLNSCKKGLQWFFQSTHEMQLWNSLLKQVYDKNLDKDSVMLVFSWGILI